MFDIINNVSEAFLERLFLRIMEPFDREDLDEAIRSDVSLLDEAVKGSPKDLAMAENAAQRFRGQAHLLTTENVLGWMKDKRYELYFGIISDPKARAWLNRNVHEFREYLFN